MSYGEKSKFSKFVDRFENNISGIGKALVPAGVTGLGAGLASSGTGIGASLAASSPAVASVIGIGVSPAIVGGAAVAAGVGALVVVGGVLWSAVEAAGTTLKE